MKFELREKSGFFPELDLGEPGKELSCYVPGGVEWTQVGYGQGEGQIEVAGCEWGFYYGDDDSFLVVLHKGEVPVSEAETFISGVCRKIFRDRSENVEVNLISR